jgi:hypothetical protein
MEVGNNDVKAKRQRWQCCGLDKGGIEANTVRLLIPLSSIALQANYIVVFMVYKKLHLD